ncbi:MAG: S41 family peptidase [Bacteroidota bacterium]
MKRFNIQSIALIFFISCSLFSYSQKQNALDSLFSIADLKSDFATLRSTLEEVHPGLYLYQTERSLDSLFKDTELKLNQPMTSIEFAVLLGKLTSQLGDGHLKLTPSEEFFKTLQSGSYMLPFSVSSYDNKLYVSKDLSEVYSEDFMGSQLISINGVKMDDFLKEYLSVVSADGANVTRKHRLLSNERYLSPYFNMLHGLESNYTVEYIPLHQSTVKEIKLKGIGFEKFSELSAQRYPKRETQKLPIEIQLDQSNSTAYLRISTFSKRAYKNSEIDFSGFLKNVFETLQSLSISNLIIDVRGNSGGEDAYGKTLFSYFIDKDFNYYKSLTMSKDGFESMKYTERPNMKPPPGMLEKNDLGTYNVVRHPNLGSQKAAMPAFKGNVLVLIDGLSYSTTSEFLSLLHYHTDALFIGEESGGGYYGNNSGMVPYFTMPKTKIRAKIPLMSYSLAVQGYAHKDRGIIPDYPVLPTIKDEINGVDVQLNFAKNLIKKGL